MRLATKDLAEAIKRGEVRSSAFTTKQLKAIEKGKDKSLATLGIIIKIQGECSLCLNGNILKPVT
ncbi:hypothetical protein F9Z36_0140 [Neisseria gonorrhoeae]|nr:hypothetical protein F9Z36_0140 [Neisseria gonorrhoeae]